jgi:2-dehydro-3-deoxyphosphooctonate aldolase (KDO 8-P synthase)
MECHEDPDNAPSDGPNMIPLSQLASIITQLKQIHQLTQNYE